MESNKQNTALLIVIAVATLLVAVVGATFAYFTAVNNQGSTATVTTTAGSMKIDFQDGTATLAANIDKIQLSVASRDNVGKLIHI